MPSTGPPTSRPPTSLTLPMAVAFVLLAVIVAGSLGVVLGIELDKAPAPDDAVVTPILLPLGRDATNVTVRSNCDGASQTSADGFWKCEVTLENVGSLHDVLLNVSAPWAVNAIVYPPLPVPLDPNAPMGVQVTGQLGYTGTVFVYLGID